MTAWNGAFLNGFLSKPRRIFGETGALPDKLRTHYDDGRGFLPTVAASRRPLLAMTIQVRLFAAIRETLGRESVELSLADGATPEDAWRELLRLDAGGVLAVRRHNLAAAVNRRYAKFDAPLSEGDEVVFIPPVSGG